MHLRKTSAILTTLLVSSIAAKLDSRATCSGAQQDGYCCQGLILQKDHNGGTAADNLICCQGDSSTAINFAATAPTSCTAGTEVPLTEAGGSSQSTVTSHTSNAASTASSGGATGASSANSAARAMITAGPWAGLAAVAGGMLYAA